MADFIQKTDTLNEGREKINAAIQNAEDAKSSARQAVNVSQQAKQIAQTAENKADNVQEQFNQVVIEGDSSVEAAQARVDADGNTFTTLKERLDTKETQFASQLAQTELENFKSSLVHHKTRKPMIVWHDDDGHKGVYTKLAPLLRKYNIKMSVAVITNRPHGFPIEGLPPYDPNSQFMSYEQMKELENEGLVEYIAHSHTHDTNHRLTDMTESEMRQELETNQRIMKQLGWNYKDFVYPFGAENEFVHSIVRQYFRSAFDVGGGAVLTPLNQFKIPRIRCDAPATFEEIKSQIDDVIEHNTLGVLTTHVDQYGGLDLDKMEQVIQYIISHDIPFVTTEEAVNEFGNLLQVGTNSIGFDGKIYGRELGVYREGYLDYPPNAPITDFEKGTVTRLKVRRADMEHYNLLLDPRRQGGYGIIETHRDEKEDAFSFQIFTDIENKWSLIRNWDDNNNEWGTWVDFDNLNYMKREVTNAPPSHYPTYKRTIEKVQSNVASEYGLDGAGLLYTEKDNESAYSYQIFYPISSGLTSRGIKIRHAISNSEWGNWYTIPTKVNTYNRSWASVTIPANSSIDNVTTANSATVNSIYNTIVRTPLPPGVNVQSYCWENGTLRTRFTNSTTEPITINNVEVSIVKMVM